MIIYMVRHGEVPLNQKKVAFNALDESLTEEGRRQTEKLADRLASVKLDAIFVSNTKRGHETALPIAKEKNISPKTDERLNDCNYGIFANLTKERAEEKYPQAFRKREEDKYNVPIPEGESFADVATRWRSFFADLKKKKLENILIVTHGTNLKVFLMEYLRYNVDDADKVYFKNTSVSIFSVSNTGVRLLRRNDTSHLN